MNLRKKQKIYTINETKILNKEALMLPQLMWFYTLDSESNKLLYLSLTIKNGTTDGYPNYTDILNKGINYVMSEDSSGLSKIKMYCHDDELRDFLRSFPSQYTCCHSFIDNCSTADYYTKEDFHNIYKSASKKLFDNEEEWWYKAIFTSENVKMAIDSVHREYMLTKTGKYNQAQYLNELRYLQFNNFTIDSGKLLDGKLTMLPKMKWIYIESKDNPHIFQIDLGLFDSKWPKSNNGGYNEYYIGLVHHIQYLIENEKHLHKNQNISDIIGERFQYYIIDFHENVLYDDIYTLEDLKAIIKNVSNGISYVLCDNQSENYINNEANQYQNGIIECSKVKTLINKSHRAYMDNKTN